MLGTGGRGGKQASIRRRSLERKRLSLFSLSEVHSGCVLATISSVGDRSPPPGGSVNKFGESSGSSSLEEKRRPLSVESSGGSPLDAKRNAL